MNLFRSGGHAHNWVGYEAAYKENHNPCLNGWIASAPSAAAPWLVPTLYPGLKISGEVSAELPFWAARLLYYYLFVKQNTSASVSDGNRVPQKRRLNRLEGSRARGSRHANPAQNPASVYHSRGRVALGLASPASGEHS